MTVHDMDKAQATYGGFMATLKWAVPVIAVAGLVTVAGTLALSATSGILLGMLAGAVTGLTRR